MQNLRKRERRDNVYQLVVLWRDHSSLIHALLRVRGDQRRRDRMIRELSDGTKLLQQGAAQTASIGAPIA